MDFTIPINDPDVDSLDLFEEDKPEFDTNIQCGQKPRNELEIAEDTLKDIRNLNKQKYPLLTMVTLLKYQRRTSPNNGILKVSFKGNVGPKENSDITQTIDNKLRETKETLNNYILELVNNKISEIDKQLNDTYVRNLEVIGVTTSLSGEARNRLMKETREINYEFTQKLKVFSESLKPRKQHVPRKEYNKKPNNSKPKSNKSVLLELAELLSKHN